MSAGFHGIRRSGQHGGLRGPDSNQTSMMSISLRKAVPPHARSGFPQGVSAADGAYQASAPSRANSSTTARLGAGLMQFAAASQKNTAMGTPQMRWREMHQSGRVAIML